MPGLSLQCTGHPSSTSGTRARGSVSALACEPQGDALTPSTQPVRPHSWCLGCALGQSLDTDVITVLITQVAGRSPQGKFWPEREVWGQHSPGLQQHVRGPTGSGTLQPPILTTFISDHPEAPEGSVLCVATAPGFPSAPYLKPQDLSQVLS